MHSRARTRSLAEAKRAGRHTGFGKRKGTADARMPTYVYLGHSIYRELNGMLDNMGGASISENLKLTESPAIAKSYGCAVSVFYAVSW